VVKDTSKLNIYDFRSRTDNKYFPNTEKGWEEFLWKVHFMGGKSVVFMWYLADKENYARANKKDS
jgi:hypothetical protein